MPTITTRPITPEEHDRVGDPVQRGLDAVFGPSPRPATPSLIERIASGRVHPLLFGAEMDGALVCSARLEKSDAGWRFVLALADRIGRDEAAPAHTQLLGAIVDASRQAGLRAFYEQGRKNVAPTFAPRAYVDERPGEPDVLRRMGLVADAPHRWLLRKIAAVRARGALVPAPGWETLEPDNLPARVRAYGPVRGEQARYRLSPQGTVTRVSLRGEPDPRLVGMGSVTWLHGPSDAGVEAARDALAHVVAWGGTSVWVHAPLASSVIDAAPDDLDVDPDERERVCWWNG